MFLKPFEADRWILVSSPSSDEEAVVTASGRRGPVASGFLDDGCQAHAGRGRRRGHGAGGQRVGTGMTTPGTGRRRSGAGTMASGMGPPRGRAARGSMVVGATQGRLVKGMTVAEEKNESESK
jgi:hypothetical protein